MGGQEDGSGVKSVDVFAQNLALIQSAHTKRFTISSDSRCGKGDASGCSAAGEELTSPKVWPGRNKGNKQESGWQRSETEEG